MFSNVGFTTSLKVSIAETNTIYLKAKYDNLAMQSCHIFWLLSWNMILFDSDEFANRLGFQKYS